MDQDRVFFSSKRAATPHCFDFARRALRAAEIQVGRIWNRPVVTGSHQVVRAAIQDILIDVHFYFIALRNLYRYLERIVEDPAFAQFTPDVNRLNDLWFKHYAKGREAFEHIDQRLPGEKYETRIKEETESGNPRKIHYGLSMRQDTFKHSDLSFDISRAAFDAIKGEVEALLAKIVDSCEQPGGGCAV